MKNKWTTTSLTISLLLGSSYASAFSRSPEIVVGIVVDQLRTDYLEQLSPYFGDDGFKRLMREGVFIRDVDFHNTVADSPAGTAIIFTGAWPAANGVSSAEILDVSIKRNIPVLATDLSKPRYDYSPENLRLSTIADEYFITYGNQSKIFSIAGNPQTAVIMSGHAGNAAIWMDETSAKWNVPSYYSGTPAIVANKNRTSPLASKIASTQWRPLNPSSIYAGGETWNGGDFSYTFGGNSPDDYKRYRASAPFNADVTGIAIDLLESMKSSKYGMFNIEYSLAPFDYDFDGDNRPELFDSYVRLDAELGKLLQAVDKTYGRGNTVVFLSSSGYAVEPEIPENEANIPTGEITLKKTESLLNSYLSATYGNGDYVLLIKDGKLYLDSKELSRKGIDTKRIREEAKTFLLKMGGVAEAYTVDEVTRADSRRAEEMALGIDIKNAPDIFLFFTPGWTVTDDNAYPAKSEKVRLSNPPTPAFILAPGIPPQTISNPVDAVKLAPTISSILRIRGPNGASARPLNLKYD